MMMVGAYTRPNKAMDNHYGPAEYDGQRPNLLSAERVFLSGVFVLVFVTVLVLVFVSVFASEFVF